MLIVTRQLQIPLAEFEITFARSSGPGGQNVNKVNSKAVLRWAVGRSPLAAGSGAGAVSAEIRQSADERRRVARDESALSRCAAEFAGLPGKTPRDAAGRRACRRNAGGRRVLRGVRWNAGSKGKRRQSAAKQNRRLREENLAAARVRGNAAYSLPRSITGFHCGRYNYRFGIAGYLDPVEKSMFHGPKSGY